MIIETNETINMPFMLNIDEAQLTLDVIVEQSIFFYQYQTQCYSFEFICETSHLYKLSVTGKYYYYVLMFIYIYYIHLPCNQVYYFMLFIMK